MKQRRPAPPCGFQEDTLIAVALDEADTTLEQAVHEHMRTCRECAGLLARYRSLQQIAATLQDTSGLEEPLHRAQERLTRLVVRQPVVHIAYHCFPTALGTLCIATSARGGTAHLGGTGDGCSPPLGDRRAWRCMKTRPPCRPYAASCKRI